MNIADGQRAEGTIIFNLPAGLRPVSDVFLYPMVINPDINQKPRVNINTKTGNVMLLLCENTVGNITIIGGYFTA